MSTGPLLRIRDLAVKAGERVLLRGLDLDLAGGELVALRAASGAGKTSLLRTLALLQDPAAGTIELAGEAADARGWPAWRRRVLLVPQLPIMLAATVREELAHAFSYRHATGTWSRERARQLLDGLGLDGLPEDAPPQDLSVGEQQRVALARALLLDPDVLLLDEPTSALDPATAEAVRRVVRRETTSRDAAALVVTHDTVIAGEWCDRVVDLATHAIQATG